MIATDAPEAGDRVLWGDEVVVWWGGKILHRGPIVSFDVDDDVIEYTALDSSAWLDNIVCRHPHPGDPEWEKWDEGQIVPMYQAWQHHPIGIRGGELSTSVPVRVQSYAHRTAAEVCDLVCDTWNTEGSTRWYWYVENNEDLTRRVSWLNYANPIDPDVVTLSYMENDRGTAGSLRRHISGTSVVSSPVIVTSDGRSYAYDHPGVHPRGLPLERRFSADPGTDEGPLIDQYVQMTYQGIVETVPPESGWDITAADRSIGMRVKAGDLVWITTDVEGFGANRYERVHDRVIGDEGPIQLTVGTAPEPRPENFWQEWQDWKKEVEARRRGATKSADLTDWDVQTADSAGADPAKQDRIPAPGKVPTWQMLRNGGVERLMLGPGDRVAKPGEKVSVAETIASGMASIVVPSPDPDRRWTAQIVVFADEDPPSGDLWSGTVFGTSLASWTFSPLPPGVGVVALSVLTKSGTLTVQGDVGQDLHLSWFTGGSTVIDGGTFGAQLEFTLI